MYLAAETRVLPLYSHLLTVCFGSFQEVWPAERILAESQANPSLPSLGWFRLRPRSLSQRVTFTRPTAVPGEIHLETQCALEALLTGGSPKGEFHEIIESASQVLLAGVAPTREIHLEIQCALEVPVEGVRLRGGHKVLPPPKTTCLRRPSDGG